MEVAIVKYNAGNIFSVVNALRRQGVDPLLTDDAEALRGADCVIFPGQGEASGAMQYLDSHGLTDVIRSLRQPVLGICIGQQLLCRHSEEGDTDCLGIFDVPVCRFRPTDHADKVPAMGWNALHGMRGPLFRGFEDGDCVYFVHSYYVPQCGDTIASTHHITDYSAALSRDNFFATQFHPEKSGERGELLLRNFLEIARER